MTNASTGSDAPSAAQRGDRRDVPEGDRPASPAAGALDDSYRLLFEANPIPMFAFDEETLRFVAVNDAAVGLYGWSREEFLRMSVLDIRAPEDRAQARELIARNQGARARLVGQVRHLRSDGTPLVVELTATALVMAGRPARLCSMKDVTRRAQAETALRESEERLRLLIEHTPAAVAMLDRDMRYLAVSRRYLADYGLGDASVLGRSHYEVFPEIPERWREIHRRCLEGAVARCTEEPFARGDGSTNWVRWEIVPWRESEGRVGGLILFTEDITHRKASEEALKTRDAQFQALIQELQSAVALIDASGRFTLYNRRFLELFGLSADTDIANINSQDWSAWQVFAADGQLLRVDDHPVRRAVLARCAVRNQLVAVRLPHGGALRWMLVSAEPMLNAAGALDKVICTYHDISEVKRAEEALRDANERLRDADRRKDEFLGMLSHELRTPLTPIRNSVYVLRLAAPGSEQARRAHAILERQSAHLARLVDDLLDVTRIARGKFEVRRTHLDLRELVVRAAEDFRTTMEERGIAFTVDAATNAFVEGDPTRLVQVIGNLLHNAAKFTPAGGEVRLSLHVADAAVELTVADTGPGIDPALLPTVFDAFTQGPTTLARTEGGLGLGLALVKAIAGLHGGTASARSAGLGQGATFCVRLPRVGVPAIDSAC